MKRSKPRKQAEPVRKKRREDSADAFIRDPEGGPARGPDPFSEELAEDFLRSATSGEEEGAEAHEREVDEEIGGPFVTTEGATEFASGPDDSNPKGATREPFPTPMSTRRGRNKPG